MILIIAISCGYIIGAILSVIAILWEEYYDTRW
jgi:hypothetical protein